MESTSSKEQGWGNRDQKALKLEVEPGEELCLSPRYAASHPKSGVPDRFRLFPGPSGILTVRTWRGRMQFPALCTLQPAIIVIYVGQTLKDTETHSLNVPSHRSSWCGRVTRSQVALQSRRTSWKLRWKWRGENVKPPFGAQQLNFRIGRPERHLLDQASHQCHPLVFPDSLLWALEGKTPGWDQGPHPQTTQAWHGVHI